MAGFNDANNQYLIRSQLWSRQIKELLLDELNAMKFVKIIKTSPMAIQSTFRLLVKQKR